MGEGVPVSDAVEPMTPLAHWILAALLMVPPPYGSSEPEAARAQRIEVMASALADAINVAVMTGNLPGHERRLWAAAVAATAARESGGLDRGVHSGERLGDRGRSICFMQINRGNPDAFAATGWRALAGVDPEATRLCADAGVASLVAARRLCARRVGTARGRPLLSAVHTAYTSGHRCAPSPEGERRAALTLRLLRGAQRELDAPGRSRWRREQIAIFDHRIELRAVTRIDLRIDSL